MIYVIYVQSGSETAVMYLMRELGYTAYVPRELYKYRKKGVWHEEIKPLFDGYIFFQTDRLTADDYYIIRKIHGVAILSAKQRACPALKKNISSGYVAIPIYSRSAKDT